MDDRVDRSFEEVVASLYPALEQRLAVVLRDAHSAADLTQETYLRAYRSWPAFDGRDPRAWLYTIGLRLAFNELRRRRGWRRLLSPDRGTAIAVQNSDPDLWLAIERLEPQQRAALVLHVVDGYTQQEIGQMLGAPAGTVGSWISRAKDRLRIELEER
ncbi:MAG: RNA polymerase sigma factor [Candidatus Limnocylindria bacterium]